MGVSGWKITKKKHRVKGDSGLTNLIGFLLKAGQGDQTLPGEWGNLI